MKRCRNAKMSRQDEQSDTMHTFKHEAIKKSLLMQLPPLVPIKDIELRATFDTS
jgi:hypothetical protein